MVWKIKDSASETIKARSSLIMSRQRSDGMFFPAPNSHWNSRNSPSWGGGGGLRSISEKREHRSSIPKASSAPKGFIGLAFFSTLHTFCFANFCPDVRNWLKGVPSRRGREENFLLRLRDDRVSSNFRACPTIKARAKSLRKGGFISLPGAMFTNMDFQETQNAFQWRVG